MQTKYITLLIVISLISSNLWAQQNPYTNFGHNSEVNYTLAEVKAVDEPGESYYRFGFNGKENDREWGTGGLTQDYGFRLYNPALGKFLSVDPLTPSYPELTPFQFASNRPIDGIDFDGLEFKRSITQRDQGTTTIYHINVKVVNSSRVKSRDKHKQALGHIRDALQKAFNKDVNYTTTGQGTVLRGDKIRTIFTYQFVDESQINANDYYIRFFDTVVDDDGDVTKGRVRSIGNPNHNEIKIALGSINSKGEYLDFTEYFGSKYFSKEKQDYLGIGKTGLHELLHTAGLYHPFGTSAMLSVRLKYKNTGLPGNVMLWEGQAYELEPEQIQKVNQTIKTTRLDLRGLMIKPEDRRFNQKTKTPIR